MAATPKVFLDIAIGRRSIGRLKFELFTDMLPITCENFRCLATGETGLGYWLRPRTYKHTIMHRIIPGMMFQGGDFNYGNGSMGESIYGQSFRDEKFCYRHSKRGVLSMAHAGHRHTCNSQFFVSLAPTPWLDGEHVVFGHVVEGMEILDAIEACGTEGGKPLKRVWVYNSGEEDRLFLRQQALNDIGHGSVDRVAEAEAAVAAAMEASETEELPPRPDPMQHISEISPVPDEIWKRAKARRDNML